MTSHHRPYRARRRLRLRDPLILALPLLLGACASYQGIAPSAKQIDSVTLAQPADTVETASDWPQDRWWLGYGDPQLDRLMQRALADSPNLATAQARIARAQAAADLSHANHRPQVGLGADASYGLQSENYLFPKPPLGPGGEYASQGQAGVNFGYELDLWGKNSALIRAAEAQLKAAEYDHAAARLALTTSIARAYVQLAAQYDLQEVLLATQQQREDIRKLTSQRVANGLDTRVELKQAETSEAVLRIELEQLATAMKISRLQLASLVGGMPADADAIGRPALSNVVTRIPQNLPLDLLGRRPELAAQRARIEAAIGEADAAKAQFYPNINLSALIGYQAIGLDKLLDPGSMTNSIGAAIRLPIFDGGRLRANYAVRTADIDTAISQYNQSVLNAAQDVAEQLTRVADLSREQAATDEALAAAEEAHRLAMLRYRSGLTPYLTVLTVETQLLAQRRASANLRAKREDLQIALLRALGGGFVDEQARAAAAPATDSNKTVSQEKS
ncbi:efflux transporter outer membrane subunit [Noviherbaspirillum massiliense]|uniref:efflux transporter outer membrane subunit n=1 Tax=Noviherbaspirillum massiliense TaxID=1465823 RepID=UPI0002DE27AB|nr:efflux transporter outer membrane subunit [Noviherbaspirillum massiliense]